MCTAPGPLEAGIKGRWRQGSQRTVTIGAVAAAFVATELVAAESVPAAFKSVAAAFGFAWRGPMPQLLRAARGCTRGQWGNGAR
jgi:hypothetical protein